MPEIVYGFAEAFTKADALRPVWTSWSGRVYRPGLGPHAENAAVALLLEQLRQIPPFEDVQTRQFVPYPDAPRRKCDLALFGGAVWTIEVKMARFRGDNGKPDDTSLKDILSPYESDRSALTDTVKLAREKRVVQRRKKAQELRQEAEVRTRRAEEREAVANEQVEQARAERKHAAEVSERADRVDPDRDD